MALNTDTNQLREIQHQVIVKELYNMIEDNTAKINANLDLFETLSLLKFKGSATALELLDKARNPQNNKVGDVYNCRDYSAGDPKPTPDQEKAMPIKPGMNVVWTGSGWDEFSYNIDLSPYYLTKDLATDVPKIKVDNAVHADSADSVSSADTATTADSATYGQPNMDVTDKSDKIATTNYVRNVFFNTISKWSLGVHHHYTTHSGGVLGIGEKTKHHDDITYSDISVESYNWIGTDGKTHVFMFGEVPCNSMDNTDITWENKMSDVRVYQTTKSTGSTEVSLFSAAAYGVSIKDDEDNIRDDGCTIYSGGDGSGVFVMVKGILK